MRRKAIELFLRRRTLTLHASLSTRIAFNEADSHG
jgi:hypothetical protein